jgi:ATP-dependent Lon protease
VQLNYLQTFVSLPWGEYTQDDLNLKRAQKILDQDHYGMEKVKERILEYMAVLALRGDLKSPIICLYGPPGVGKTSLGKSIASAMKRKYVRMSLGGLHDEAEIRGHRRTYIGAMPGRIIKSIQKAGSSNPVFILDEIDKVTQMTHNGDPASALLEVLDPEQNNAFHDNYLDVDYDLSKVLFIATANNLSTIPRPLLDRMEVIEVSGYITEEKYEIAKRHLIPRELENTGLKTRSLKPTFNKAAIEMIIERYTRESGVRQLEKQIDKALRKIAFKRQMEADQTTPNPSYSGGESNRYQKITPTEIEDLLGKPPFYRDIYQGNDYAGVVTGLAWTSVGGEILFIETSLSKGKGAKLTLTGNLGDVMKESAILALEYVKAHAEKLNIDYRIFDNWNIHIHVPEGATPKDGPSAGITIATSIASALTQRKVRKNTAMTGEITLRGKVLPVGGIKEKILAAKRAGITDIVMCRENEKDINEIPDVYLKGVTFHYVENVQDVWDFALTNEIVEHPLDFTIPEEEEKGEKAKK